MRVLRPISVAVMAAVMSLLLPAAVAAASSSVECGQLTGYTAPDPAGPTDGSLQLGLTDPWVVLATATVSTEAAATLPTIVNSGPTCLDLDFDDDGAITSIGFATEGSLTGTVDFDSASGFYLFADRLIIPTFVTDATPALAALFVTSYQAGTELTVTFTVDPTSGQFVGFDGVAAFCGTGSVTSGGDGQVGDAIIPAAVLDDEDLEALEGAGSRQTCATVHAIGTINPNNGEIDTTTDVDIDVAAAGVTVTPPPTSTMDAAPAPAPGSAAPGLAWLVIVLAASFVVAARSRSARRD